MNHKPGIIFKASNFCRGEDWTGSDKVGEVPERELWGAFDVCFQPNAWQDTETFMYLIIWRSASPFSP
jgi:hypothetical protein